jgi:hypothetical protein
MDYTFKLLRDLSGRPPFIWNLGSCSNMVYRRTIYIRLEAEPCWKENRIAGAYCVKVGDYVGYGTYVCRRLEYAKWHVLDTASMN